jgi:hypothetical protein
MCNIDSALPVITVSIIYTTLPISGYDKPKAAEE